METVQPISRNSEKKGLSDIKNSPKFAALATYAEQLNDRPGASIKGLIHDLVIHAFTEYGMLDHEFMALFNNGFATNLAAGFLEQVKIESALEINDSSSLDPLTQDDPEFKTAKDQLSQFLDSYDKSISSLYQRLQKLKKEHPRLKVIDLFDKQTRDLLVAKINQAAAHISKKTFREEFATGPEEFMRDYIFPRLISPEEAEIISEENQKNIAKFVDFLDENDILDEHLLHHELFSWFMRKTGLPEAGIDAFRSAIDSNLPDDTNGFPRPTEVEFDKIWNRFFEPQIARVRAAKMSHNPNFDEFVKTNKKDLEKVIPAKNAQKAIWEFLDAESDHRAAQIRHYFSNSDQQTIANDLQKAKDLIKWTFDEFFADTYSAEPIRKEFDFTEEIIAAGSIEQLLDWSVRPIHLLSSLTPERHEELVKRHGRTNVLKVISHEASMILKYLLVVRNCANARDVQNRERDREEIEEFFIELLQMGDINKADVKTISFRVKEKNNGEPKYDLVSGESALAGNPGEKIAKEDGTVLHELENKNFYQTQITIPANEGPKTIPVYVYANEKKQLFHTKDLQSIVSNFIREGKDQPDFTDLVRTSIIPVNPDDYEVVREYFAKNFMTDGKQQNNFDQQKEHKSSAFPVHKRANLSGYVVGKKTQTRLNFEVTVVQNIKDFLLYSVSDNTESSYRKYRARREAPTVDNILHPAAVYGSQTYRKREKIAAKKKPRKVTAKNGQLGIKR